MDLHRTPVRAVRYHDGMVRHDPASAFLPPHVQPVLAAGLAVGLVGLAGWLGGFALRPAGLVDHDTPPIIESRFTVDINAAGLDELATLPGVGPTTATRIVEHRRTHGPFGSPEGLLDVPGIGAATLDQLRPHLQPIRSTTAAAP
jgi:competence ComEA-like helix-hairpin-helix protein